MTCWSQNQVGHTSQVSSLSVSWCSTTIR